MDSNRAHDLMISHRVTNVAIGIAAILFLGFLVMIQEFLQKRKYQRGAAPHQQQPGEGLHLCHNRHVSNGRDIPVAHGGIGRKGKIDHFIKRFDDVMDGRIIQMRDAGTCQFPKVFRHDNQQVKDAGKHHDFHDVGQKQHEHDKPQFNNRASAPPDGVPSQPHEHLNVYPDAAQDQEQCDEQDADHSRSNDLEFVIVTRF
jgi:hypothetical protein